MNSCTFTAILELAATTLPAAGVSCLLIGGFAVNHYGYTRNTLDIDFMIASDQIDPIRAIMHAAGFTNVSILDGSPLSSSHGQGRGSPNMTRPARQSLRSPPPPHLTMDEYVAWIQASLQQVDPVKAARQKALQEQIATPFHIKEDDAPSSRLSFRAARVTDPKKI